MTIDLTVDVCLMSRHHQEVFAGFDVADGERPPASGDRTDFMSRSGDARARTVGPLRARHGPAPSGMAPSCTMVPLMRAPGLSTSESDAGVMPSLPISAEAHSLGPPRGPSGGDLDGRRDDLVPARGRRFDPPPRAIRRPLRSVPAARIAWPSRARSSRRESCGRRASTSTSMTDTGWGRTTISMPVRSFPALTVSVVRERCFRDAGIEHRQAWRRSAPGRD